MMKRTFSTNDAQHTRELAKAFSALLQPGETIALGGNLGAGKTCWVQGLAAGLGIAEPVVSPTYTLAVPYSGRLRLIHVDAYRIVSGEELEDLALQEELESGAVVAIEWFERFPDFLPDPDWQVALTENGALGRTVEITATRPGRSHDLQGFVWPTEAAIAS